MAKTKELDSFWKELTSNFGVLTIEEKKAIITRTAPMIIGIYEEFGYRFDGLDNARDIIKSI